MSSAISITLEICISIYIAHRYNTEPRVSPEHMNTLSNKYDPVSRLLCVECCRRLTEAIRPGLARVQSAHPGLCASGKAAALSPGTCALSPAARSPALRSRSRCIAPLHPCSPPSLSYLETPDDLINTRRAHHWAANAVG